jgi:hypothetical protein
VARTETEEEKLPVWPENWRSLSAFLGCETQWRVASTMSRMWFLGLDYVAVKVALDVEGHGPEVFEDLRTMEAAALPVLNKED